MRFHNYIKNASREAVVEGVRTIKRYHIGSNKILSERNPLVLNSIKSVKKHTDATNSYLIKQSNINSFLAASSLSHLLDGWQYLSNAFNALLNGDESTTIHLAYYAELRSAMSILATEGIGVFNDKHIGVYSPNINREIPYNYYKGNPPTAKYVQTRSPTHTFVWDMMEKWTNSAYKSNNDILKIFKVHGKDFYDITEYFHPSTAGSTLLTVKTVKQWLKEWCFDIKQYRNDRDNRNEASYRPQRIINFNQTVNFQTIISDLENYWSIISPSGADKFSLLDRYLLRKLFDTLYSQITTTSSKNDLIIDAFTQLGINDNILFNFLNYQAPFQDDHKIFQQAGLKKTTTLSILARATLLLRITIGLVSQLYKDGGIQREELNFVWNQYALDSGFWSNGNLYHDFNNLWSDVETSISDLKMDINNVHMSTDLFSIKSRRPQEIIHFSQINRACLWGLDF